VEKMIVNDRSGATVGGHGRNKQWIPPPQGSIKMNCNGSVNNDKSQVGIGVILRDASGALVGAMSQRLRQRLKPRMAELFAIKLGLEFALANGWVSFQVESDCMEAVNLLSRDGECLAAEGVVVEEVKRLMDTACSRCDLCFKDCQYGSS
jgi:hypothetical protein